MVNDIISTSSQVEKLINFLKRKKKLLLIIIILVFFSFLGLLYLNNNKNVKNIKISQEYVKAGIFLSSKNNEKAKIIYKDIILSKNKFYSLSALNNIIENNLEDNNEEVLTLFKIIENSGNKKEYINLVKLKKSLYLKKISKIEDADKLLKEIIEDNSMWKKLATEISN